MGLFGIKDNRNELHEDSGLLTEKSNLPVIQLRSGDTGASSEDGNHTLGKLKCYGMEWREIAMELNKPEQNCSFVFFQKERHKLQSFYKNSRGNFITAEQ